MNGFWNDAEAEDFVRRCGPSWGVDLAHLTCATRLAGSRPDLAMHGGGNASLKGAVKTLAGDETAALFVKASGVAMNAATLADFVCLDLAYLRKLRALPSLGDEAMAGEFRTRMLRPSAALPSIETLMHAFLAPRVVLHTHPSAILALTNRREGDRAVRSALGGDVGVVPYAGSGLALGQAVAAAYENAKGLQAIVVLHHGLVVWGETPKEAYERTLEIVGRAEASLQAFRKPASSRPAATSPETAQRRYGLVAPLLRGLLSPPSGDPDRPHEKILLSPLITAETLDFLESRRARQIACTAPVTPDYLVRTKAFPLFLEEPDYEDGELLRRRLAEAIDNFRARYEAYRKRYVLRLPENAFAGADLFPKVLLLPGLGAVCVGPDLAAARIVRDITGQDLAVKRTIGETGGVYQALTEDHLFEMEFRALQRAKVAGRDLEPLRGNVALVTGAAGAIGSAICEELLRLGCHVAATDLAGEPLEALVREWEAVHDGRVLGVPLDVAERASVEAAFERTAAAFGGIDILVINAGLAHVSALTAMDLEAFRRLERVNVEGTLLLLAQAEQLFRMQNTGGDVVLISTKNVFAPGAGFGAYSATKAAAHQLCRIASLEFARIGVRVNMVAPDAVFSHREKKSGLWAQVGPDRMKARGLDERGLEEYYRERNLLKARIRAEHVARAVAFFVTRQTPTTGVTLPVDGGLPEATPR